VLHADLEINDVQADLALIDQALILSEHKFDRIPSECACDTAD
jgi:hypothetical protein